MVTTVLGSWLALRLGSVPELTAKAASTLASSCFIQTKTPTQATATTRQRAMTTTQIFLLFCCGLFMISLIFLNAQNLIQIRNVQIEIRRRGNLLHRGDRPFHRLALG